MATAVMQQTGSRRLENLFFSGMALLILASMLLGFARSYFLAGMWRAPLPSAIVHVHGAVFSSWILLLIAQISLVSARQVKWHRRLGMLGAGLATAMVVLGIMAATDSLARGFSPPGSRMDAATFFAFPFVQVAIFAVLIGAAFRARRDPATHKRLMLIATIAVLGPAINRWPFAVMKRVPLTTAGVLLMLILLLVGFDISTRRKIHRATLWGGLTVMVSQLLLFPIGHSAIWHRFAGWSVRVWTGL